MGDIAGDSFGGRGGHFPQESRSSARRWGKSSTWRRSKRTRWCSASGLREPGKTYLAVCLAVAAFKSKQVEKIILTRPPVEAGEKLGFLPGDLQTKVDPYLRPLYDALQEMLGAETYAKLMEKGVIEVAPLAYMRGRPFRARLSFSTKRRTRRRNR